MAFEFYVTITGTKQGRLQGEENSESDDGAGQARLTGIKYRYEVSTPRQGGSGMATGKRVHSPVVFTKRWGPSSPQLLTALFTNEVLTSVLFEFVRVGGSGQEEIFHTVTLHNAVVTDIVTYADLTDTSGDPYDGAYLEDISLVFRRIEIENKPGKTTAMEDLGGHP